MPEIIVYAAAGRSSDQKRKLLRDITSAVVENFNVSPDLVVVQIVEVPKSDKSRGGVAYDML